MTLKEPEKEIIQEERKPKIVKFIYLTIGFLFLAIGLLGVVLPVLPTTPFLLITAYCFAKGSCRFHQWFCSTSIYHKYLENYVNNRAMTLKTKLSILLFSSTMMIAAFIVVQRLPVRCFLVAVLLFHWGYFFFRIKTKQ